MNKKLEKIVIDGEVPSDISKGLPALFEKNSYIIPDWCSEVRVIWDASPEDEDGNASDAPAYTDTQYEYRFATVAICPSFLAESVEAKDKIIKHELGHIITSPIIDHIFQVLEILDLEEETLNILKYTLQQHMEAVTEDLTTVLLRAEDKKRK